MSTTPTGANRSAVVLAPDTDTSNIEATSERNGDAEAQPVIPTLAEIGLLSTANVAPFFDSESDNDSWSDDETPPLCLNHDALKHIATYYLPGNHGKCVKVSTLARGTYHEIRLLRFADGWSCIGRFSREDESLAKLESELATMAYVRKHTTIPVPEVYYVNANRNHPVGAVFVLMERMTGGSLAQIWENLSLQQKTAIVGEIAGVLVQLANLKFSHIGSLRRDSTLGPLLNTEVTNEYVADAPFATIEDYLLAFVQENDVSHPASARALYPEVKAKIRSFLASKVGNPIYHGPFRLIHDDFDWQNILVSLEGSTGLPKITAVIDWDYAHTGPLYFLFDYPRPLQDDPNRWREPGAEQMYDDNKILRQHFVRSLEDGFPAGSDERKLVRQCFREKNVTMNVFHDTFMSGTWANEQDELEVVEGFLMEEDKNALVPDGPYGRLGWWPDSGLDSSGSEGVCEIEAANVGDGHCEAERENTPDPRDSS